MRVKVAMLAAIFLSSIVVRGCGAGSGGSGNGGGGLNTTSAPTISTTAAQNGALIVRLASATPGAVIFYTVDGSQPTPSSQPYQAPFLVASNLTVNAIAVAADSRVITPSTVTSQSFAPNIPSGTLVWSDEFTNNSGAIAQPNPAVWTYDTGNSGFGNKELETYCAWGSSTPPCSTANPSAYVGTDGYLHIEAQQPSALVYTSARLKTQGLRAGALAIGNSAFSMAALRCVHRYRRRRVSGRLPGCWETTAPR